MTWDYIAHMNKDPVLMTKEKIRRLVMVHGDHLPCELCELVDRTGGLISDYPSLVRSAERACKLGYVEADIEIRRCNPTDLLTRLQLYSKFRMYTMYTVDEIAGAIPPSTREDDKDDKDDKDDMEYFHTAAQQGQNRKRYRCTRPAVTASQPQRTKRSPPQIDQTFHYVEPTQELFEKATTDDDGTDDGTEGTKDDSTKDDESVLRRPFM